MIQQNSDQNEDFEDTEFEEEDFDDFDSSGGGRSFKDLWENSPLVKIGVIVGALAVIVMGIVLFGGGGEQGAPPSRVGETPQVTDLPDEELDPSMQQALEEADRQAEEEARSQGQSFVQTPMGPSRSRLERPQEEKEEEDPLAKWRRAAEERQRQREPEPEPEPQPAPPPQPQGPSPQQVANQEAISSLAEAMAQQMQSVLARQTVSPAQVATVTQPEIEEPGTPGGSAGPQGSGGAGPAQQQPSGEQQAKVLFPAGDFAFAQLLNEANSDAPAPVLAQIVSGPLRGARAIGNFDVVNDEFLVLRFDRIVLDGRPIPITAVAMDPSSSSAALRTSINRRTFRRVILPAAAEFIENVGEAIAETSQTTVTVDDGAVVEDQDELDAEEEIGAGVEAAAEEYGEFLDEEADRLGVQVKVAPGTPVSLLFIEPVLEGGPAANTRANPGTGAVDTGGSGGGGPTGQNATLSASQQQLLQQLLQQQAANPAQQTNVTGTSGN